VFNLKRSEPSFDEYLRQAKALLEREQDTLSTLDYLPSISEKNLAPAQHEILRRLRDNREDYISERLEWDGCDACADMLRGMIDYELRLIKRYFDKSYTEPQSVIMTTYSSLKGGYGVVLIQRDDRLCSASTHPFAKAFDSYLEHHRFTDEPPKNFLFEGVNFELTQLTRTVYFKEELAAL
jgi:hypothetical protein